VWSAVSRTCVLVLILLAQVSANQAAILPELIADYSSGTAGTGTQSFLVHILSRWWFARWWHHVNVVAFLSPSPRHFPVLLYCSRATPDQGAPSRDSYSNGNQQRAQLWHSRISDCRYRCKSWLSMLQVLSLATSLAPKEKYWKRLLNSPVPLTTPAFPATLPMNIHDEDMMAAGLADPTISGVLHVVSFVFAFKGWWLVAYSVPCEF